MMQVASRAHAVKVVQQGSAAVPDAERISAEVVAHALLRLAAEHPGCVGRERAARIVGGFAVAYRDEDEQRAWERYALRSGWRLRELVGLVDTMIDGGLLTRTLGPRPTIVATRAGHHALNALEGIA